MIANKAAQAIHVLDRFNRDKAVDEVRGSGSSRYEEANGLTPVLNHSPWCLLMRP
jgi:hypothetical protein